MAPVDEEGNGRWRVSRFSVVGPAHLVDGRPNQDALAVRPHHQTRASANVSIAVADGHGHPAHCRSATGARLAAAALTDGLIARSVQLRGQARAEIEDELRHGLIDELTRVWREAIADDLRVHPPTSHDYGTLAEQLSEEELTRATLVPAYQYGTTALGAAVADEWVLLCGIGDGDVIVVDADLTASCPLAEDESSATNLTASLCQPEPAQSWRAAVVPRTLNGRRPVVILAATDGLTSGMGREALCREAKQLAQVLVSEDHVAFERALWDVLGDAQRVLGDDATIVALYEERAIERLRKAPCEQDSLPTQPRLPAPRARRRRAS